tara:strand:+ start:456 stop:1514 length:1059 start_codon:yes stop_codon:yes gene_type:complete
MVYINKPLLELSAPQVATSATAKEQRKAIKDITDPLENTLNYAQEANLNSIYVELNYMIRENITTSLRTQNDSYATVREIFSNDTIIRTHDAFNHIFNATRNEDPYNQITNCQNAVVQLVKFFYSYITTEEVLSNLNIIYTTPSSYNGLFNNVNYHDAGTGVDSNIDLTDAESHARVGDLIDIARSSKSTHEHYIHSVLIGLDGFNCFKMFDIVNSIGNSLTATYNNHTVALIDRFPDFIDPVEEKYLYVTHAPNSIVAELNSKYTKFKTITNYDSQEKAIDFSNTDTCKTILDNNKSDFNEYDGFNDESICEILDNAYDNLPAPSGNYTDTFTAFNGVNDSISEIIRNNLK